MVRYPTPPGASTKPTDLDRLPPLTPGPVWFSASRKEHLPILRGMVLGYRGEGVQRASVNSRGT